MSAGHEEYLAVLKASYDYKPQSEDEIAIREDQILFLKEQVDDDWWKVKMKGDSQDDNPSVGLVPAAYVEQADHISKVKVLYDYEAAADGELSVEEDEILLVFETEDDWILAQSEKQGGKAGFVPGNYVEPYTEEIAASSQRIVIPPSPSRPVSTYVDPADRVAATKVTADGIKTWSVSEIDKKGKKKKGTLGIGNGAVFFASESDKTPVQKWQTADVQSVSSEKAKHVNIEIGGTTPITLHYHAVSKDNAEEIIAKLNSSKALSLPQPSVHETYDDTPQEDVPVRKKASVHFSNNSPVIIPSRDDTSEPEEGEKLHANGMNGNGHPIHHVVTDDKEAGTALYDFVADGDDELSVSEGQHLIILERDGDEWWKCRNSSGKEGVVPASYIEVLTPLSVHAVRVSPPPPSPPPEDDDDGEAAAEAEQQRAEAQRAAEEQGEQERLRAEQAKKKADAQRRAKEAAEAAELERRRRKEAASRVSSLPAIEQKTTISPNKPSSSSSSSKPSGEINRPAPDKIRTWHDRSGQFRVEAAFLGFNNGKLRLHKVNGVIVEVPSEKMSIEDMKHIERLMSRKSRPPETRQESEDDIPLALSRPGQTSSRSAPPKAAPKIDWFDFFLSAGCDLDDCTRYASAFEKDKLDETLIQDITEGTMRLLGVREGDIIRIKKAVEKRKPTDNFYKPSTHIQEQVRRDEELARKLQAQESGGARVPAPNLFSAGPGGVLKASTRRGRPTQSKTMPPAAVDLNAISAISTTSDHIQRTSSPQVSTPTNAPVSSTTSVPRPNSVAPVISGFDDDAWTNRPSSTKPLVGTPAPRAPSVPPAQPPPTATPPDLTPASTVAPPPATVPAPTSTPTTAPPPASSTHSLANTTEDDVFAKLAQYGEMRRQATPVQPPPPAVPPVVIPPSFQVGLGMGSSSSPMGQLLQAPIANPPQQPVPYNGPRGPFAPVPANQSLLQPLIPTQTGFTGMVPTRASSSVSPFSTHPSPSFLSQQPTGFLPAQPLMSHPTGVPLNGFNAIQPSSPISPLQNQFTGFNPNFGQSPFNNHSSPLNNTPPPVPSLPTTSSISNTSPANVFAQMKSGTFATDHNTNNMQTPPVITAQSTGWGQPYQGGFTGFQR
ncbi:Actin cytoskeleton-regulatory complex protein sla1 [Termitomyces sp. J132]|nr:Actin cytoskeleton-regulatory complex protein sla1 [Termitomyces sp. J132]